MRQYYKHIVYFMLLVITTLTSCQEDEKLNLPSYPEGDILLTIAETKGASEAVIMGTYEEDGSLQLDGLLSRTYNIRLNTPVQEDVTINFEPFTTNIPMNLVEISANQIIIPTGFNSASVTLTMKDETFDFASAEYDEKAYELGVRLTSIQGTKVNSELKSAKVVVKKEAYQSTSSLQIKDGKKPIFKRISMEGAVIVEPEPIEFKFVLNKPALNDVTYKLSFQGLSSDLAAALTPIADVTIPKGQKESENVVLNINEENFWKLTNGKLIEGQLIASIVSGKENVVAEELENSFSFTCQETDNILEIVPYFYGKLPIHDRVDWTGSVTNFVSLVIDKIIDCSNQSWGIYPEIMTGNKASESPCSVTMDMIEKREVAGFSLRFNSGQDNATKIAVVISDDGTNWKRVGTLDAATDKIYLTWQINVSFLVPQKARYIKLDVEYDGGFGINDFTIYRTAG